MVASTPYSQGCVVPHMVTLLIVVAIIAVPALALAAFAGLVIGAGLSAVANGALELDEPCDDIDT
jgi:hypothetical protein